MQREAGLDFRPIVRWQDVHVEIFEGFGEAAKVPEDENGVKGFDETRRRLGRGCFMGVSWTERGWAKR